MNKIKEKIKLIHLNKGVFPEDLTYLNISIDK